VEEREECTYEVASSEKIVVHEFELFLGRQFPA
jgi:hypothetical protein